MPFLVSDTSVIIDLDRGDLLEAAFKLDDSLVVPDLLFERELDAEFGARLRALGIIIESLDGNEVRRATQLRRAEERLSVADTFAFALAQGRQWTLLTGDSVLRSVAEAEGVAVHGVLWIFDRFRAKYGKRSAATMTARHVSNLMAQMAETPSAANNLKKRLAQVFDFAILMGVRSDNPARAVRAVKTRSGGYRTWQEEQIAAFEARWPIGTQERLAFDLALYTGQRKSDVCRMGPQHVKAGRILVSQIKTGKDLQIPIHPDLAKSIAATPSGHLAFIVTRMGVPRTRNGFGNWFRSACNAAGLEGYAMHGLRKACARRMAELGLSNQLIKSITGHTSDAEVARYTRDAEQVKLADRAMSLANRNQNVLANHSLGD